ncbi:MAG TPA: flagellar export chaperone FliS [Gaiellaceae bacterium]|jgi:flagellar protein FliS
MNPYAAVKQAYTEASVMTATPQQLVVMLYDGAIRFLAQSAECMRAGRREQAHTKLRRAEAIIDELNRSLDMSYGEIPSRLRSIYLFSKRQLIQAHVHSDPQPVEHVGKLLSELRESWDSIAQQGVAA